MLCKQGIIGYRRNGYPIWEIMGGSEPAPDGGEPAGGSDDGGEPGDSTEPADNDGDKPLGEKGEKALQAEKEKRRKAQAELRKFTELNLTPEQVAELAAAQKKQNGDEPPDPEQLRKQARQEAQTELLRERTLDKIEVKAAKTFNDPEDARRFLADRVDEFIDDGEIDAKAITTALDKLVKDKPYLSAQGGKRFQGSGDGGSRTPSKPDPGPGMARMRAAYESTSK